MTGKGEGKRFPSFPSFSSAPNLTKPSLGEAIILKNAESEIPKLTLHKIDNIESYSTFVVDRKGDMDIFSFDYKLEPTKVPQLSHYYGTPIGFPNNYFVKYELSGGFQVESPQEKSNSPPGRFFTPGKLITEPRSSVSIPQKIDEVTIEIHNNDYIEIPDEPIDFFGRTRDDSEELQAKALNLKKCLKDDPHQVSNWIKLVSLQDELAKKVKIPHRSMVERKLAIMEAALGSNPGSLDLLIGYLELQSDISNPNDCLKLWEIPLQVYSSNWKLRFAHVQFYLERCFSIFSVDQALEIYLELGRDMIKAGQSTVPLDIRMHLIKDVILLLLSSGFIEYSTAIVYVILWTFLRKIDPENTLDNSQWWSLLWGTRRDSLWRGGGISTLTDVSSKSATRRWLEMEYESSICYLEDEEEAIQWSQVSSFSSLTLDFQQDDIIKVLACFLDTAGYAVGSLSDDNGKEDDSLDPIIKTPQLSFTFAPPEFSTLPMIKPWKSIIFDESGRFIPFAVAPNFYISSRPLLESRTILKILEDFTGLKQYKSFIHVRTAQLMLLTKGNGDGMEYVKGILKDEPSNWDLWLAFINILRWQGKDLEAKKKLQKLLGSSLTIGNIEALPLCQSLCELLLKSSDQSNCIKWIVRSVIGGGRGDDDFDQAPSPTSILLAKKKLKESGGRVGEGLIFILNWSLQQQQQSGDKEGVSLLKWDLTTGPIVHVLASLNEKLSRPLGMDQVAQSAESTIIVAGRWPDYAASFIARLSKELALNILTALPAKFKCRIIRQDGRFAAPLAWFANILGFKESISKKDFQNAQIELYSLLGRRPFLKWYILDAAIALSDLTPFQDENNFIEIVNVLEERGCHMSIPLENIFV